MRIVLAALLATALAGCGVPPDSEMIAWFHKNRADFIALRDMARQEKSIARIGDGFVWLENNFSPSVADVQAALPPERMADYKRLFERLRLPNGISIYRPELSVCMSAFAQGLAVSGSGKGYCWLPKPPQRLVTTPLEAWPDAGYVSGDNFEGYREIEPGWYLKQDSS